MMDAEMMQVLSTSSRLCLVTVVNWVVSTSVVCALLERRRNISLLIIYKTVKTLLHTVLISYILKFYYGEMQWLQIITLFSVCSFSILTYVVYYYTFKGGLLKVAIAALVGEVTAIFLGYFSIAAVNLIERKKDIWNLLDTIQVPDLGIPVIVFTLYLFFNHYAVPYLHRFRDYKLRCEKILWLLFIGYVILGSVTMIMSYDSLVIASTFAGLFSCIIVVFLCNLIVRYQRRLKAKQSFLTQQQKRMEENLGTIQRQIYETGKKQLKTESQMEEISQMNDTVAASIKIEEYLAELKESYEEVRSGIYCDNWMIDAVLCTQRSVLEHRGIHFECKMQKFSLGMIEEQDFIQLLLKLLDLGLKANQETEMSENKIVHLGVSAVKNQLIIKFSAACGKKMQIPKRVFREYLKKYSGTVQTGKGESRVSCALSLQRE
ncbi:hypothetical protein [Faecalicatena orotica]|uniref:hypothetical protein n=1 Tax=Faecalicatena orotica TaxID=1544 RepID=UPI003217AAA8